MQVVCWNTLNKQWPAALANTTIIWRAFINLNVKPHPRSITSGPLRVEPRFWHFLKLPKQPQYAVNAENHIFVKKAGFISAKPHCFWNYSTVSKLSPLMLASVFPWGWKTQLGMVLIVCNIDWELPLHAYLLGGSYGWSQLSPSVPRTPWAWRVILLLFYGGGDQGSEKSNLSKVKQTEKWCNQDLA